MRTKTKDAKTEKHKERKPRPKSKNSTQKMDSAILEQQRALHEEIERIEQAVVRELLEKPRTVNGF